MEDQQAQQTNIHLVLWEFVSNLMGAVQDFKLALTLFTISAREIVLRFLS
jgi:hypothetical protein